MRHVKKPGVKYWVAIAVLFVFLASVFWMLLKAGLSFGAGMLIFGGLCWIVGSWCQQLSQMAEAEKRLKEVLESRMPAALEGFAWEEESLPTGTSTFLQFRSDLAHPTSRFDFGLDEEIDPRKRYKDLTIFSAEWQATDDTNAALRNEGDFPNADDDVTDHKA